jgi:hypothetical protein
MNHYWQHDDWAKVVGCPLCHANSMDECITNKGTKHKQGYVHKGRSMYYIQLCRDLLHIQEKEVSTAT